LSTGIYVEPTPVQRKFLEEFKLEGKTLSYTIIHFAIRGVTATLPESMSEDIIAAAEAAAIYGKTQDAIIKACKSGRIPSSDCRKSGNVWLISKRGLYIAFGQPKT
jgi:uncharacterized OB-fold protein